jgi:hypothetical protein
MLNGKSEITIQRNMDGIDREFTYFQEIIPAKKKIRKRGGGSIHTSGACG